MLRICAARCGDLEPLPTSADRWTLRESHTATALTLIRQLTKRIESSWRKRAARRSGLRVDVKNIHVTAEDPDHRGNKPLLAYGDPLFKRLTILIAAILSTAITGTAVAQHGHRLHRHTRAIHTPIICNERGCSNQPNEVEIANAHIPDANGNEIVVSNRPAGCPHDFCGCEASRYIFGEIRPELNLASNWIRKFPRSAPAPGMAAARNHHVMVLMSHVSGNDWLVHDGNSGGGLTREHVRSISGYIIVDPRGSRSATLQR